MADYTIRVEADTRDSEEKVNRLDKRLNDVERTRKIDIHLPSLQESIDGVKSLGEAIKTAFNVAKMLPGNPINDLEDVGDAVGVVAKKVVDAASLISKATPTNILGNSFSAASEGAVLLSKNIASLGYQVFGITQSVNILKSAFGGFFDETIGREIKLQETLLRTKTTLVSTADVAVNGKRLTDPYQAILKLEGPVNRAVDNIRTRSLEIAGTTSDAIIQTFGVVAGQIGSIGGSIKDAEDLALSFAGALGTLGLSDPMYATQEIRSILTGNIDQNSVLARSLGLTNEDVARAKKSADGLVSYLQKRLEAFTAGQSLAAKGFAGIVSNIQEVQQELARTFGKPFLQPLLDGLTKVYERLQLVTMPLKKARDGSPIAGPALGAAEAVGRTGNAIVTGVAGAAMQAPSLARFTQRAQYEGAERLEKLLTDVFLRIQAAIDKMRPQITLLAEEAVKAGTQIVKGLGALAAGFAQFKFENFRYLLAGWIGFAQLLNNTVVPALKVLLQIYGQILGSEEMQRLAQFSAQWQVLEKAGILPVVRGVHSLHSSITALWPLLTGIPKAIRWIGSTISGAFNAVLIGIASITKAFAAMAGGIIQLTVLATRAVAALATMILSNAGSALVTLSQWLQRTYPEFAKLAALIYRVGLAFTQLSVGVAGVQVSTERWLLNTGANVTRLQLTVDQLKAKLTELNASIQASLGKAGNAFLGLIGNIAKFFAWQLIFQVAVVSFFDAMQKYNEQQQNLSDKTRAELAVRRLSTAYKDLGENASLAARKAKEFEESIVSNRISDVTKKIEELSTKIRNVEKVPKELSFSTIIPRLNFGSKQYSREQINSVLSQAELKSGRPLGGLDEVTIGARLELQRLSKERHQLAQENQNLLKVQEKADSDKKSKENIDILAKERKDLEKQIADYRKALNKEITDNEFNSRQERLQIEQNAREAQRAAESAQMSRDMERNLAGVTGVRRQVAEILNTYQKRQFDIQTESQRRQFEFARTREKFEKNLADYKLKLEEQTLKMRQRMNDYSVKVTKWENEEKIKTAQRVLQYALKAGEAISGQFTLLPEDRSKFLAAAEKRGLSAERILALAKTIKPGDLPIAATNSPEALMDGLGALGLFGNTDINKGLYNKARINTSREEFEKQLNQRTEVLFGQSTGGSYALRSAAEDLQTDQFKKLTPSPPPKAPGLSDILSDNRRAVDAMDRQQRSLEATTAAYNRLKDALDQQSAYADKMAGLRNIFLSGVVDLEQLKSDVNLAQSAYQSRRQEIRQGTEVTDPAAGVLASMREQVKLMYTQLEKQGQLIFTEERGMKFYLDLYDNAVQRKPSDKELEQWGGNNPFGRIVAAAVQNTLSQLSAIPFKQRLNAFTETDKLQVELLDLPAKINEELISGLDKMREVLIPDDPVQRRLFQANQGLDQRRRAMQAQDLFKFPEVEQAFSDLSSAVRLSATKLGEFDQALADFATKVALIKDAAATITDSLKTGFKNLLTGNVTGFQELVTAMREKLTTAFTDWAFKPIQNAMEEQLRKIFKVDTEAERLAELQRSYTQQFNTAVQNFSTAVSKFTGGPGSGETPVPPAPTPEPAPIPGAAPASTGPVRLGVDPSQEGGAPQASATAPAAATSVNKTAEAIGNLKTAADQAPPVLDNATNKTQQLLGGLATMAAGIAGIVAGFQQIGKKGASNTLMGLSSIFIGLGSTFMGAKGAGFFRATGGPVKANSPYIVGEEGPEWFVPNRSGTVLPHGSGPGGGQVNSVVNVHLSDGGARTDNNQASQLGRMIDNAVINVLNRERRPGGVLAYR